MRYTARCLRPITEPEPTRAPIIACDVETDGFGGEFISGAYCKEHTNVVTHFSTPRQWLDTIMAHCNRGSVWYAHNGGEYDYKYLIPELLRVVEDEGATVSLVVQANARVIGFTIRTGKQLYQLRDSCALLPMPLDEAASVFAPDYPKLDIGLDRGTVFDPSDQEHRAYLERDVLALKHSLLELDSLLVEHFDTHMQWSCASSALLAWRRTLDHPVYRQRPEVEDIARAAYFGGLTYPRTTKRQQDVLALDCNAMYASAMRRGVPVGAPTWTTEYIPNKPGFYNVRVTCPKHVAMPFIGKRIDGAPRWPSGTFETTTTSIEIEKAQKYGYQFEIIDGFYFPNIEKIFDTFIDTCEAIEVPNKETALGETVKLLRNSLYGKFGARKECTEWIVARDAPTDDWYPAVQWNGLEPEIIPFVWCRDTEKESNYMNPHWAAWITAHARLMLVDFCEKLGHEHVIYCDTDSLHASRDIVNEAIADERITISKKYGDLKIVGDFVWFKANAPKDYDFQERGGECGWKSKGMPTRVVTPEHRDRVMAGEKVTVEFDMLHSTLNVLTRNAPLVQAAERSFTSMEKSPGWQTDGDLVRPVHQE